MGSGYHHGTGQEQGFALAIGNLPVVPPAEAVAALQTYHFVDALFDFSVAMIRAEMGVGLPCLG